VRLLGHKGKICLPFERPPNCRLPIWAIVFFGHFGKITVGVQNFRLLFSTKKFAIFSQKYCLGHTLGVFFTNLSGHSSDLQVDCLPARILLSFRIIESAAHQRALNYLIFQADPDNFLVKNPPHALHRSLILGRKIQSAFL
jgi:uncharacterized membrane protein